MVMVHSTAFDRGCCLFLYGRCMAYPALQNLKTDFEGSKKGICSVLFSIYYNNSLKFSMLHKKVQKPQNS